jgi:hypothetical protein
VILLDQVTERGKNTEFHQSVSGNLLALYDTVQYLKGLGIEGYQQTGYDVYTGAFETLHAYLLSRLLWDADMTREEYNAELDGFLKAYYGASHTYIRQYIDKVYDTEGVVHSGTKSHLLMMMRSEDKDFSKACFDLWKTAIESADSPDSLCNVEMSSIQMNECVSALRDRTYTSFFKNLVKKYGFATS